MDQSWYGRFSTHNIPLVYISLNLFSHYMSKKGKEAFLMPKNYAAKSIEK